MHGDRKYSAFYRSYLWCERTYEKKAKSLSRICARYICLEYTQKCVCHNRIFRAVVCFSTLAMVIGCQAPSSAKLRHRTQRISAHGFYGYFDCYCIRRVHDTPGGTGLDRGFSSRYQQKEKRLTISAFCSKIHIFLS